MPRCCEGATHAETLKNVQDVCLSMHKVESAESLFGVGTAEKHVIPCRLNPANLLCTCKGARHCGICSHILAVSHIVGEIDLKAELATLARKKVVGRPQTARGRRHIQPEQGTQPEPARDEGEDLDDDLDDV